MIWHGILYTAIFQPSNDVPLIGRRRKMHDEGIRSSKLFVISEFAVEAGTDDGEDKEDGQDGDENDGEDGGNSRDESKRAKRGDDRGGQQLINGALM